MKAYKVVERESRYGSNAAIWLHNNPIGLHQYKRLEQYIAKYNLKKYVLKYIVGTEVEAAPGSPGIMCFKELEQAKKFAINAALDYTTIIQVNGETEDIIHDNVPIFGIKRPSNLFLINPENASKEDYGMLHIEGVITFSKVTVLS